MLQESNLLLQLCALMPENALIYFLYGDPTYPQQQYIFGGFYCPGPGSPEAEWNTTMSKVSEVVEWGFKEIVIQW